ncbi:hypothetical protein C9J21_20410 [Photobacterium phosphoreum]|uniref:hypothetical protein n=1 Tax=Photobacterium phosphoreum TaxID=659 RepID=UPI000D168FC8|nr:hypothetical protein [Photobacterium phosphoreum]PSW28713.1 hypothetical protein C9J21_20410 [Photobacterium phosphoreum]
MTSTTMNANHRKCAPERLMNVDNMWIRALELLENHKIEKLTLVSKGTVILFVNDCVIFNSISDAPNGIVEMALLIKMLTTCNTDSKIESFNPSWSLEAISESGTRYVLIDSSKVSAYVLPTLNFTAIDSQVTNQNLIMTCSYDELAEMMGISDHKNIAPAIQFEPKTVKSWKKTGVPLAVARRCSAILAPQH